METFPVGTYNKIKERKIIPLRINRRIGDNANQVQLPSHVLTSNIFNVTDLMPYVGDAPVADGFNAEDGVNSRASCSQTGEIGEDSIFVILIS